MESQETLINTAPLCLKFNKKSITNSTLYSSVYPVYRICSNRDGTRTDIYDLTHTEDRFATIKRREFLPDVIKYRNRGTKIVKVKSWLKPEKLPNGLAGVSFETPSGRMSWRYGNLERYRLALYKDKDFDSPVAFLDTARPQVPMVLVVEPGFQEMVEDILISALILEHKLKMFERLRKHDLLYGPILGSLISFR